MTARINYQLKFFLGGVNKFQSGKRPRDKEECPFGGMIFSKENFPDLVEDEPRHTDVEFCPLDEMLIADVTGKLISPTDGSLYFENSSIDQVCAVFEACNWTPSDNIVEEEDNGDSYNLAREEGDILDALYDDIHSELFDQEAQKMPDIETATEIQEFQVSPSFYGVDRQSITPKTRRHAKPNAKKRFCDYLKRMRQTIRTAHFNQAVAEAEFALVSQQV